LEGIEESPASLATLAEDRDLSPDRHRKQLFWLAMFLIGALTLALVLLVAYGYEVTDSDYAEPLLLIGLLAFLSCTVAYFLDKEREQRAENRRLILRLHATAQALDARVGRLNKLSETSVHLAGALDVEQISQLVVEALVAQVRADAASLVLMDKSKGECLHAHRAGELAQADGGPGDPVTIARAAAEERPSVASEEGESRIAQQLEAWGNLRASMSARLKVSEVVGGALAAVRQGAFDTEEFNLLTTLANMAGKAIESAELHQELRDAYFKTLHVLARSLAARDPYSAAHGEAVTWVARRVAQRMHLDGTMIQVIDAYGPLHDLGKVGIPDSVLLKQGTLTGEELEIVRQHTLIGEEIMRPLNPDAAALALMRSHHERWDGSGYPDGLEGEQIPLVARIVAVADAFHAIVSHRSYRGGMLPFEAVQEIRAMSGVQFDPAVVDALTQLWQEGELAKLGMRLGQAADPHDALRIS
jgi:HD-GYP domain-containing protein (c-di-GMP phosphodiesterase class II)